MGLFLLLLASFYTRRQRGHIRFKVRKIEPSSNHKPFDEGKYEMCWHMRAADALCRGEKWASPSLHAHQGSGKLPIDAGDMDDDDLEAAGDTC